MGNRELQTKGTPCRTTILLTYGIFAVTGVGLVLPGNLMPVLMTKWRFSDEHAGYLFLVFFAASMSGALLARGSLPRSIARGCLLVTFGVGSLAIVSVSGALFSIAAFGLGLGIVMTSISLWFSRSFPTMRTARMARLNLLWAIGACSGPFVVLWGTARFGEGFVLWSLASVFLVAGALAYGVIPEAAAVVSPWSKVRGTMDGVPYILLLMVPLATGIESGTGGWLATYSNRTGHGLQGTIASVTLFWMGMLLSRFVQSFRPVAAKTTMLTLYWSPWLMAAGLALLLSGQNGLEMTIGAFVLGGAIGPLYPQLIAVVLGFGESGNIVFVLGGVGSALLPWVTGLVSTHSQSLRTGLCVLLFASILMGLLARRMPQPTGEVEAPVKG